MALRYKYIGWIQFNVTRFTCTFFSFPGFPENSDKPIICENHYVPYPCSLVVPKEGQGPWCLILGLTSHLSSTGSNSKVVHGNVHGTYSIYSQHKMTIKLQLQTQQISTKYHKNTITTWTWKVVQTAAKFSVITTTQVNSIDRQTVRNMNNVIHTEVKWRICTHPLVSVWLSVQD